MHARTCKPPYPHMLTCADTPTQTHLKSHWSYFPTGKSQIVCVCLSFSDPEFVSSAFIEQSADGNPTGDDDKIYFFFTEVAKEYDLYTKVKVPRVARVCKVTQRPTSWLNHWLIDRLTASYEFTVWLIFLPPVCSVWRGRDEDSAATLDHLPQGRAGVWGQTQRSALQHPNRCFHHATHTRRPQQHALLRTVHLPVVSWGTSRGEKKTRASLSRKILIFWYLLLYWTSSEMNS